jgi:hypothetical protein
LTNLPHADINSPWHDHSESISMAHGTMS